MKTLKNILAIELFILFLLVSCSIEKKHYLPGYHIEWEGSNKKSNVPLKMARKDLVDQTNKNSVSIPKDSDAVIMFAPASTAKERKKYVPITKAEGRIGSYEKQNTVAYNNRKNASIPNRNNQKKDKKSRDGIFAILGGLIGLLTFGGFKIGISKVKKVSCWANNNKWKARGAFTAIKLFLGGLGLYLGSILYNNDVLTTNLTTNSLIGISLCAALLYPEKNKKHKFNTYSYVRQKTFDLILSMSGFMLMASIGNQASASKDYFPLVSGFNQQIDKTASIFSHAYNPRAEMITNKKNCVNNEVNQMGVPKESAGRIIGKIILTILALALFALLEFLILGLSCTLSCNGSEVAAAIVGVGGTILNVLLLVAILKAIFKKYTMEVKTNETIPIRK